MNRVNMRKKHVFLLGIIIGIPLILVILYCGLVVRFHKPITYFCGNPIQEVQLIYNEQALDMSADEIDEVKDILENTDFTFSMSTFKSMLSGPRTGAILTLIINGKEFGFYGEEHHLLPHQIPYSIAMYASSDSAYYTKLLDLAVNIFEKQ